MIITRCPNCHARFRVTEGQLKLAEGQVRCGACLKVFNAPEHEVSSFKPEQDSPVHEKPETPVESVPHPASSESSTRPPSRTDLDTAPASTDTPAAAADPAEAPAPAPAGIDVNQSPAESTAAVPLIAEPLQLAKVDDERNPVTTAFLLLGILLTLAVLLSQLLWFERARLARHSQLQGVYSMLCNQINCDLDSAGALSQIRNHSLHVQPHPRFADALKVSIVLENTAPFPQPWPALQLRFTDLKGREVAQRTFQPDEYLDTRSLSTEQMMPGQPMQIELELASPGRRGVSYELSLQAPTHDS